MFKRLFLLSFLIINSLLSIFCSNEIFFDLNSYKLKASADAKNKIILRNVKDKREYKDNQFGILTNFNKETCNVVSGKNINQFLRETAINCLENSGFKLVNYDTKGQTPVMDLEVLNFEISREISFVFKVKINVLIYSYDGGKLLFNSSFAVEKSALYTENLNHIYYSYEIIIYEIMKTLSALFTSDIFLESCKGIEKELKNYQADYEDKRLSSIPVIGNEENNYFELNLKNNKFSRISRLENYKNLRILSFENNSIKRMEKLDNLINLFELDLQYNNIEKIENLDNLTNLKALVLASNKIKKISGLDKLTNLEWLFLKWNKIGKIENLNNCKELKSIDLSENKIEKMENIDQLAGLEYLNLGWNDISKIRNLDNLKNLRHLIINDNQIEKIENLDNLQQLELLNLSNNSIKKIENLKGLYGLKTLNIAGTDIKRIENIEYLFNLNKIIVEEGQIKSITKSSYEFLKTNNIKFDNFTSEEYVKLMKIKIVD